MDENNRKIALLDMVLALIVLALFALAPASFELHRDSPELIRAESNVGPGNSSGTSILSKSLMPSTYQVSMEATDQSIPASGIVSDIPNQGGVAIISRP